MNTQNFIWHDDVNFFVDDCSDAKIDSFYDWVATLNDLPGREAFDAKLAPIADEAIIGDDGSIEYRIGDNIFGYKE